MMIRPAFSSSLSRRCEEGGGGGGDTRSCAALFVVVDARTHDMHAEAAS